jgi:hypothetical protein
MLKLLLTFSIAISSAMLAGCASQPPAEFTSSVAKPLADAEGLSEQYALSASELRLGCKQLTGRMQVHILQLRDYDAENDTSAASRAFQATIGSIFSSPSAKSAPAPSHAQERARLEVYNRRLAELKCKTYDLSADLTPQDVKITPQPVRPANASPHR